MFGRWKNLAHNHAKMQKVNKTVEFFEIIQKALCKNLNDSIQLIDTIEASNFKKQSKKLGIYLRKI